MVLFVSLDADRDRGVAKGTGWMGSLYGLPPKAFERHLVAGTADEVAARVAEYRAVGARARGRLRHRRRAHRPVHPPAGGAARRRRPDRALTDRDRGPMDRTAHIVGTATTNMQRRDLTIEAMSHQVVDHALTDAGLTPDEVDLVVFGNATAGRLLNQACIRGQSFLLDAGLRNAGIINVDNSCAGGASALHLAALATLGGAGTVLAVGVEKMWTGHRLETLAGIEDGVPEVDRQFMHANWENPSGSVLMALNAKWTVEHMEAWGTTVEQIGAAAVKARRHGALNPHAQFQSEVTLDEVLASPPIVPPLTRLMCSSFTDGAAAVVLSLEARSGSAPPPVHDGPVGQRRHRLPRPAGRDGRRRLGRLGRRPGRRGRGGAPRRHQRRGDLRPRVPRLLQAR